jgi:hypothetical protein
MNAAEMDELAAWLVKHRGWDTADVDELRAAVAAGAPLPADTVEHDMWMRMYLEAQKRFEGVCMAILRATANGASHADVVDLVGEWLDGVDCVDDESLALFEAAKARVAS